jgi:hypothetical protein
MNKGVIIAIVAIVLIIIIVVIILLLKSSGAPEKEDTVISDLLKSTTDCKSKCTNLCKSHPIISLSGNGRRKCKADCSSNCEQGKN